MNRLLVYPLHPRPSPPGLLARYGLAIIILWASHAAQVRAACPFCDAQKPTFSQKRDQAKAVWLAALVNSNQSESTFAVQSVLKGSAPPESPAKGQVTLSVMTPPGSLYLLLGAGKADAEITALRWEAIPVDERSLGYFQQAPGLRVKAKDRLQYFIPFLEDTNPAIAEDAYLEFGHSPFDIVASVSADFPQEKVRSWMVHPLVPQARKGFFGLVLGMAQDPQDQAANVALLEQVIATPGDEFRAGFDGALAGYVLLQGAAALDRLDMQFLLQPKAAEGDIRHLASTLRFLRENQAKIPRTRVAESVRLLLRWPGAASGAIVDLARWKEWEALPDVAALFGKAEYPQPDTLRAMVGYLKVCPLPEAQETLTQLKQADPQAVQAAEDYFALFGGAGTRPVNE